MKERLKLTESDKEILKKWGYTDNDMRQIEKAISKTVYRINYNQRISSHKAVELLGRETFLSGISRSVFHWSASRNIDKTCDVISFDSSKLFE